MELRANLSIGAILLFFIFLLFPCSHGQLCDGVEYPPTYFDPSYFCGPQNLTELSFLNGSGHLIDIIPCGRQYDIRLSMTCPATAASIQVCDDSTGKCTPCDLSQECWAPSTTDSWVKEFSCLAFNRTGPQRVIVTFPNGDSEGTTIALHRFAPVSCLEPGSPQSPSDIIPTAPPSSGSCDPLQASMFAKKDTSLPNLYRPLSPIVSCGFPVAVKIVSSCRPYDIVIQICDPTGGVCNLCPSSAIVLNELEQGWFITASCASVAVTGNQSVIASFQAGSEHLDFNSTIQVECTQDEKGCESSDVTISATSDLQNLTCGNEVNITVTSLGRCSLFSNLLEICDPQREHCEICGSTDGNAATIGASSYFRCRTITTEGPQIFNASYSYGPLAGFISLTTPEDVTCPQPELCGDPFGTQQERQFFSISFGGYPINPRPNSPNPPCGLKFGGTFVFSCGPASISAKVCDDGVDGGSVECSQCLVPYPGSQQSTDPVTWWSFPSCQLLPKTANQTVIVEYQLGSATDEVITRNETFLVECPEDQQGCTPISADNLFTFGATCGNANVRLFNPGLCSLNATGLAVCFVETGECSTCSLIAPYLFNCQYPAHSGLLNFTLQYSYGPLHTTLSKFAIVRCFEPPPPELPPTSTPEESPESPELPPLSPFEPPHSSPLPPPIPCDSRTVSFVVEPPTRLQCNGSVLLNLSSTSGCVLTSGGMLVCDSQRRNCHQVLPSQTLLSQGVVLFNVRDSQSIRLLSQPLVITATYQLGPFIGTISTAVFRDPCASPSPPPLGTLRSS